MNTSQQSTPSLFFPGAPFIARIEVDDLFGAYTYRLGAPEQAGDPSRLFLLYGDNGSGKTTVIRLIFNLLSPAEGRGHRTYVASVPFRRFHLELGDGTTLTASRTGRSNIGGFHILIARNGRTAFDATIHTNDDNKVPKEQPELEYLIHILSALKQTIFYLSDDRQTHSSLEDEDEVLEAYRHELIREEAITSRQRLSVRKLILRNEQLLELTLRRFSMRIRETVLQASSVGEANVNSIYTDIVRRIARGAPESTAKDRDVDELLPSLAIMEARANSFARYGLMAPLNLDPMITSLNSSSPETRTLVTRVVRPYLDSITARLNALQGIQDLLATLMESVNGFLTNKSASFDLSGGLLIRSRGGDILAASTLSSGERQLLLLLCNTVLARERSSLFLIDEPELSLNVKWQRHLLDALLTLTANSPVQFVIASHSLELLSKHRHAVRKLEPSLAPAF